MIFHFIFWTHFLSRWWGG